MEKIIFIPDTHVPYHNKKAFQLLLKVIKEVKPHTVVILGDFADFYSVSSHSKDPGRTNKLQEEVEEVHKAISEIEVAASTAKRLIYIAGNHEDRLERYIKDKAPELFGVVNIPDILTLDEFWEYVPYKSYTKVGKLFITHDTGKSGPYAHIQAQAAFQSNVIIGHTHRLGYSIIGNAKDKPHVAAMFGWLGDVNTIDYQHKINSQQNWALGFGIGYKQLNGNVFVFPIPIVDYSCVVEGKLFKL